MACNIPPAFPILAWHSIRDYHLVHISHKYVSHLLLYAKMFECNLYLTKFETTYLYLWIFELIIWERFLKWTYQRAETIIWYSPSFMNTLLVILDFPLLIVVVKAWTYLFFRHKILVFLCMSKYLYPYFCSTCRKSANAHPILQYAFPCTILQHQNLCVKELYPDFVLCATSPCK